MWREQNAQINGDFLFVSWWYCFCFPSVFPPCVWKELGKLNRWRDGGALSLSLCEDAHHSRLYIYIYVCVCVCVCVWVGGWVGGCARAHVRACVPACERVCVGVGVSLGSV